MSTPGNIGEADLPHAAAWAGMLSASARAHAGLARHSGRMDELRYAGRLLEEIDSERARMARELHAGAGQPLAGIRLNLELLAPCAATMEPEQREAFDRLSALTEQALDQIRALSHRMHPELWRQSRLGDALRELISASGVQQRLRTILSIADPAREPGRMAKSAVYRCAQECLANSLRHSGATELTISLAEVGPWLELRMGDNGQPITDEDVRKGGLGLRAMREHAELAGGECEIIPQPAGKTVIVRVQKSL